ncbi:MAG: nitronate monooxygenase [Sediminibacterium sp.]|nr:nitronate monooxygenase [Sediminibacterium sp.]
MEFSNRITQLFNIQFPIIQAGMVWVSGWKLASAVSNAGGLGIIGAGSMYPDVLLNHIQKCKQFTSKPFAVNLPLLFPSIQEHIKIIIEQKVPIVFTSAGSPKTFTQLLKENGIKVVHVISSSVFAKKCEDAGCDAIVAEGFEAGGHNGKEETTSLVLLPLIKQAVKIPIIAAGGFATGNQMAAAFCLGAEGVQIGSRFVCSTESSAHPNFLHKIIESKEGDTKLSMKKTVPVRLLQNLFAEKIWEAENKGATDYELKELLGKGRAKLGMFEGNMTDGELEIGQIAAIIKDIKPAAQIVQEIWQDFISSIEQLSLIK